MPCGPEACGWEPPHPTTTATTAARMRNSATLIRASLWLGCGQGLDLAASEQLSYATVNPLAALMQEL
jgi:hypothetical protein